MEAYPFQTQTQQAEAISLFNTDREFFMLSLRLRDGRTVLAGMNGEAFLFTRKQVYKYAASIQRHIEEGQNLAPVNCILRVSLDTIIRKRMGDHYDRPIQQRPR